MIACPIGGRVRTQIGGYTVNVSLVGTGRDGVYGVQCRRYILHDRVPSSAELGGAGNIKSEAARAKFAYNNNRSPTTNILVGIMLVWQTGTRGVRASRG